MLKKLFAMVQPAKNKEAKEIGYVIEPNKYEKGKKVIRFTSGDYTGIVIRISGIEPDPVTNEYVVNYEFVSCPEHLDKDALEEDIDFGLQLDKTFNHMLKTSIKGAL